MTHEFWRLAQPLTLTRSRQGEGSETWLSEEDGPINDVHMLLAWAPYFTWDKEQAPAVLTEVYATVKNRRQVALDTEAGLGADESGNFAAAFLGMSRRIQLLR